jgi:hypothetical protein
MVIDSIVESAMMVIGRQRIDVQRDRAQLLGGELCRPWMRSAQILTASVTLTVRNEVPRAYGAEPPDTMPIDAYVRFWQCPACRPLVTPKRGDCCVFCSYGTVPCPPRRG